MKVKDIERTANIAWSPAKQPSILLAAGTAAQQFDASFSTNACLEIYSLNVSDPSLDTELKATANCEHRFHKIIWGSCGGSPNGTIVGGCDNGIIQIYNVEKLLSGEPSLEASHSNHNGAVHALDFNPFQENLLATGAGESEIYIWDMNNTHKPMTPGSKTQPFEDIVSIQWNKAVQPILAATFVSKCSVWDLRKNEPIIKLTDTVSRIRWKTIAWHPHIATQLCLASEEDQAPTIQLWDLRFATQALNTFENHQRGVLSMAWCMADPDLLISSGKDNRILCWNPNSNQPGDEVLSEVVRTNQWNFDVTWCPKSPVLVGSPSFDGHISIYTVVGGHSNKQVQTSNKIADSFPGMDGYIQAPVPQQTHAPSTTDISKAPKWLKKPVSAKFGFGGKLITVTTEKTKQPSQSGQVETVIHSTYISQVVTEPELVNKSAQLEQAIEYGNYIDYCRNKADIASDQHKKYIWHFLRAHFEENSQLELLNLLGYRLEDVNTKLSEVIGDTEVNNISDGVSSLNTKREFDDDFDRILQTYETKRQKLFDLKTGDDTEGLITEAILMGNIEIAVELCMKAKKYTEAIILAKAGGDGLFMSTQDRYLKENNTSLSCLISSLINSDWGNVVDNCNLKDWKEALVGILRHCNEVEYPNLCERLGNRLMQESANNPKWAQDAQLCYICSGSFDQLVSSWSGKAQHSTKDLQELVELVMLLKRAIEHQGRTVEIAGRLADLLSNYAFILASQGNLQTALNYLGNSTNEQVAELRNRLFVCLGQESGYGGQQQRSMSVSAVNHTHRKPSYPTNTGNAAIYNPYNPPVNSAPSGPAYNQFNPPNNIAPNQSWQPAPTRNFSPAPPAQPSRPPSVGSTPSSAGLYSRAKYILDPSVQSNAMSNMNMNLNPSAMPQPVYPAMSTMAPSVPAPPVAFNENSYGTPRGRSDFGNTPGWNDPPAFTRSAKSQAKSELSQQDPITHPIYGTAPISNTPNPPMYDNNPGNLWKPQPQMNSSNFQPPTHQPPPLDIYNPAAFNTQAINTTAYAPAPNANNMNHQQQQNVMGQVEKPQPIQKAPIPEEHIHMQTVFDELRSRCTNAARNPQMKRKLEDVSRKLENLYDLLRERKLTPNTLTILHQMCQMLQNGDYVSIQRLQTELAESPDFAQVASFMPGVKVLLQCAQQLQVYLR